MDSPSGRPPGDYQWGSTLWHEMSHVFILTATNHRVPRWFTEGLAVHEETQASPEWGDRVTPEILLAVRDKKLLPVADLDRGFIRPEYASQVIVSYFQAGRILRLHPGSLGRRRNAGHGALVRRSSKPRPRPSRKIWACRPRSSTSSSSPGCTSSTWVKWPLHFDEWRNRLKDARRSREEHELGRRDSRMALRCSRCIPITSRAPTSIEFLAEAYMAKGDKKAAAAVLTEYEKIGGHEPARFERTGFARRGNGQSQGSRRHAGAHQLHLARVDEDLHRQLCDLLVRPEESARRRSASAMPSWHMHPLDQASAQFNARARLLRRRPAGSGQEHICWRRSRPRPTIARRKNCSYSSRTPRKENDKWPHSLN